MNSTIIRKKKDKITFSVAGVYCFTNKVNGKRYIGSTSNLSIRFCSHIRSSTNKELRNDIEKYGMFLFSFYVLEFIDLSNFISKLDIKNKLYEREQFYIDTILKDEHGNLRDISYNVNPKSDSNIGKPISEETRIKMSNSAKIKLFTEEHKKKISKNHFSKKSDFVSHAKGKPMHPNAKSGINKYIEKNKKTFACYDNYGELVAVYDSLKDASLKTKIDTAGIGRAANGIRSTRGGFYWRKFEKNEIPLKKIDLPKKPKIIAYDLEMNIIGEYENCLHVEKLLGVYHSSVARAIISGRACCNFYFERK